MVVIVVIIRNSWLYLLNMWLVKRKCGSGLLVSFVCGMYSSVLK